MNDVSVKDIDVLFSVQSASSVGESISYDTSTNTGLFNFWADWISNNPIFREAQILSGDSYSRESPDYPMSVVRVWFADTVLDSALKEKTQTGCVDILIIGDKNHKKYVNENFDCGLCKILYSRSGLYKSPQYLYDSDNNLISILESQFTKQQLFDVMKRDHLSRIRAKYPGYDLVMVNQKVIDDYNRSFTSEDSARILDLLRWRKPQ